ncbi:MAG: hypothetical protein R3A48_22490 [Polyangiales bacterium]
MRAVALAACLLVATPPAAAQDLYERAARPGASAASRDAARAAHLEFLSSLPARFLDLFGAASTRAERDALRLQALRLADRALAVRPHDTATRSIASALRERLGDYANARRDADLALALAPEGPEAPDLLFTRALVRTRLGDHAGTRDDYLLALRFPLPEHTRGTVLGNLADTYLALGDTGLAVETFGESVRHAPDYALGWLGLAIAQDRQGEDPDEAAARALEVASTQRLGAPDAIFDELTREGVFFVPSYDRYTYEAMAHEALARRFEADPSGVDRARRHRASARVAWEAWSSLAPADDRWRPVVARHLARVDRAEPR